MGQCVKDLEEIKNFFGDVIIADMTLLDFKLLDLLVFMVFKKNHALLTI
jgi:hypothetical protein